MSSICALYTPARDLVHPEADQRERAVQYLKKVAEFAARMECPTIIVHPTANGKTQRLASESADAGYNKYLSFELLPPFADPFAALAGGGGEEFFDTYTEQAIRVTRSAESQLSRV